MVDGAREATAFYRQAFGAEELFAIEAPDGSVVHAEMSIDTSVFMLGDTDAPFVPPGPEGSTVGLHVYVPDVDDLASRAADAGAEVLQEADGHVLRRPVGHVDGRDRRPGTRTAPNLGLLPSQIRHRCGRCSRWSAHARAPPACSHDLSGTREGPHSPLN